MNIKKHLSTIIVLILLSFLGSLSLVLTPYFIGLAVDRMLLGNTNFNLLKQSLLILGTLYLFYFLFTYLLGLLSNRLAIEISQNKRQKINDKMLNLPLSFLDRFDNSHVQNLMGSDSNLLMDGLNMLFIQSMTGVFTIIIALVLMFKVNGPMTLGIILLSPIIFLVSRKLSKSSLIAFRKQQEDYDALTNKTRNIFENNLLISTYNYHNHASAEFIELNDRLNTSGLKAQVLSSFINPTTRLINNMLYVFVAVSGALSVIYLDLSIGLFLSFISYTLMFTKPINELSSVLSQLVSARSAYERIEKFLELAEEKDSKLEYKAGNPKITFDAVEFSYSQDQELIKNLNLNLEPLSKIAIVGPTGSGKSTLINLLMRYYDLKSGAIYFNEQDISKLSKESVRNQIGIVLQEPWVFDGSIAENIAYGKTNASRQEIIKAAKQAGAHHFITRFPQGYDTLAKQELSVGEKQMITIARALLLDKPIYILDEATSNLDSLTEYKIQATFEEIMKHHTSFFVAHRLHTIVDADVILVMKEGKIIEKGNHEKLMAEKGFYKSLYESQF